MIEYEVNLVIDADLGREYLPWLREHIARMLALPGFVDATVAQVEEPSVPGSLGYCVRYRLRDRAALQAYLNDHAAPMRAEGVARFGDRVRATRRVLDCL